VSLARLLASCKSDDAAWTSDMTFFRRFWFFVTRWRRLKELDDEMALHVELRAAANRRRGLSPADATREARRRFGNQLKLREESRDMWGFSTLERIGDDLRYAARQVLRRPAWTLVVVLTLALGIGANTAIFSLIDTMLFKPASWNAGGQGRGPLVWISSVVPRSARMGSMPYPDYQAYRDRATTLSGVVAFSGGGMSLGTARGAGGAHPRRVLGGLVSGNYFDVLGLRAAVGRTFTPDEDGAPGAHPVVVLGDALWRAHFGADPTIVNSTVAINGLPFTIIGVAPPGFTGVAYADNQEELWMPLAMEPVAMRSHPELLTANINWLEVVGRLRDGVTVEQADAEMRVIARQLNPVGTPADREKSARVIPVRGGMMAREQHDFGPTFGLVAMVPGLVLLVACANVANVLMARHVSRRKELAMRRAMGASRARLIRLLLTESLLLALLSAAAGFVVSFGLIALIIRLGDVPDDVTALVRPDVRALVATTALAMLTTIVFGLAPALSATKFDLLPALKDEGTTATAARGGARVRRLFVVAQMAISLALLIVAGLFVQSLSRAMRVDTGFDPRGVVTASFDLELQGYNAARRENFIAQLVDRVSAIPGVTSVAVSSNLPLSGESVGSEVTSESSSASSASAPSASSTTPGRVRATSASVSPRYFETLRVPLLRGREFSAADTAQSPLVVIINDTLSRQLWPGEDAIGKRLQIAGRNSNAPWREVVGVVRDIKGAYLSEPAHGEYYVPLPQRADAPLSLVVRTATPAMTPTAGEPTAVLSSISNIARDLDRDLPLFKVQLLDENLRHAVNLRRASASLLSVFGLLTLVLAAIGVYGVAAHSASLRIREVGIRMSLGARATDVSRMFLRETLSLAIIGVAIGLALSAAASKLLTAFLFGLTSTDTLTFAACATILCLVALTASYLPARRAAHIDPLVALRHD
jgi:predicted permease